jgi:hypothetical protein
MSSYEYVMSSYEYVMSSHEYVMNRDSPGGRRIERNSAFIWFPLQGEAVALADRRVVTHGRGPFCAKITDFPSSGRTSQPLSEFLLERTTTERLTNQIWRL